MTSSTISNGRMSSKSGRHWSLGKLSILKQLFKIYILLTPLLVNGTTL